MLPCAATCFTASRGERFRDRVAMILRRGAGASPGEPVELGVLLIDRFHPRGNHPFFAPPKTRKTREVPLPTSVRDELAAYLARYPAKTVTLPWDLPDGPSLTAPLLITSRESGPVNKNYFNAHLWKTALRTGGAPATRQNGCHALRHYFASVLLHGGESIKALSDWLGHSDPSVTLSRYMHLMPETASRTASIIDAAFGALDTSSRAPDRVISSLN